LSPLRGTVNWIPNISSPRLIASAPVFLARDVVAAANHYRDAMGFDYERFWGEPPSFVILHRDGMYLMLKQADDPKDVIPHWTVSDKLWNAYFWVSDADALHAEFVSRGAKIDYGPCDQPHGCREFGIQDLDGYDVGFGQRVG
jgi:predicted enzyme related to lactoylglutathione lyase